MAQEARWCSETSSTAVQELMHKLSPSLSGWLKNTKPARATKKGVEEVMALNSQF